MSALARILVALGVLVCLAPAAAAAPTGSVERLSRDGVGEPRVRVDASTGLVEKVIGRFRPRSSDELRSARAFLRRHARAFGISPSLADLALAGRSVDVGGTVLRFAQHRRGIPVRDGSIVVGFDPRGDIIHVDNGYVPGLDAPARPLLSRAQAIAAAEAALGARLPASRDVQLVFARGDRAHPGHHLAWEVAAVTERPRGDWRIVVDSRTGAVVRRVDGTRYAGPPCVPADPATDTQAAFVFARSPVDALNDPHLTDASNVDSALAGCTLSNLTSSTDLTGAYVNTSHTPSPRAAPPYSSLRSANQRAVDEANAYFHVNRSKEYLNDLGFAGVVNHSVDVNAAADQWGDFSVYIPSFRRIELGTGGVDDAQDPDIVYHELMHAIQDDQVPGFGTTAEAGALGEGIGDYWAATLTDEEPAAALGAECVGAWNAVSFRPYDGRRGSGCLRRVDGDGRYPRDLEFAVHDDGEIYSAALWALREAVGSTVLDRLVIKGHTFLQPDASFLDAADALLSADLALHGGAHAPAIHAAMRSRGIPRTAPPASSDGLTSVNPFHCSTANPYGNGDYVECRYEMPGATRLRVHFSRFKTEHGWDYVRVSDGDYREVQALSGAPFASTEEAYSAAVSGDTIVVRFKSDTAIAAPGFAIDRVEYATNAPPDCSAVTASPDTIHATPRLLGEVEGLLGRRGDQFTTVTLAGATDPDGDAGALTFRIDSVTQDEPVTGSGDRTSPDARLVDDRIDSNQVQVRGERRPTGDGRVYRIGYSVSDGSRSCSGTAKVLVPRTRIEPAVDNGDSASWDSFTGDRRVP